MKFIVMTALAVLATCAILAVQPVLAQQIVSEDWNRGCSTGPPTAIGANGTVYVSDWHDLKSGDAVKQLLSRAFQQGMAQCPTAYYIYVTINQRGMTQSLITARWERPTGQWQVQSTIATLTQREEQQAAAEHARKDREQKEAQRRQEIVETKTALRKQFMSQFKPEVWVNQSSLTANVFMYKDKVVGLLATFDQMVAPSEARFGQVFVTDVPTSEFSNTGQETVLAIKIVGLKHAKMLGTDLELPQGRYVGAYKCRERGCKDFFE